MILNFGSNYLICKMKDKYYIFSLIIVENKICIGEESFPFHTEAEAHLFLLEKAKQESKENTQKVTCLEVLSHYVFAVERFSQEDLPLDAG